MQDLYHQPYDAQQDLQMKQEVGNIGALTIRIGFSGPL